MAELHNPLFKDEKEFLERQKLEYERALRGDVDRIKAKTTKAGKIALIGAGVVGGVWLLKKAFGGNSEKKERKKLAAGKSRKRLKKYASSSEQAVVSDDLGFGSSDFNDRAHLAPDVYHAGTDDAESAPLHPARRNQRKHAPDDDDSDRDASSIVAETFQAFMQSATGKMLVAQASAVLIAYVAKKAGEYLPVLKNPDLADASPPRAGDPRHRLYLPRRHRGCRPKAYMIRSLPAAPTADKALAVLLDPDQLTEAACATILALSTQHTVDYFFVGGSLVMTSHQAALLRFIKSQSAVPVLLFPSHSLHLDDQADGILLLSLISGRNPDFLIGQHVLAAPRPARQRPPDFAHRLPAR